jgi:8-oxo-dGTP pyrophosphatase MutT (NUDIX family)
MQVFPGGGIEFGEALQQGAAREVEEETGFHLNASSLVPLCLWESVFPTTIEECEKLKAISGHYLIVFFVAQMSPWSTCDRSSVTQAQNFNLPSTENDNWAVENLNHDTTAASTTIAQSVGKTPSQLQTHDMVSSLQPTPRLQDSETDAYVWIYPKYLEKYLSSTKQSDVKKESIQVSTGETLFIDDILLSYGPNTGQMGMGEAHKYALQMLLRRWSDMLASAPMMSNQRND